MKNKTYLLATGVAIAALISPAVAADDSKDQNGTSVDARQVTTDRRAGKVIGMEVKNHQDEKLGSVEDLVVNLSRGRVTALVISTGGFLGIGNELSIVPAEAFTLDEKDEILKLNVTKDRLSNAPRFQSLQWPDLNDRDYMNKLHESYNVVPGTTPDTAVAANDSSLRASKILNLDVKNPNDDNLGNVKELVLDGTVTKLLAVVISSGGFLGIGNDLSVVPPQSLVLNDNGQSMKLDATKETLMKAPHFDPDKWPDRMGDDTYLKRIHEPFRMKRTDKTAPDNTGVNRRDRDEARPTPLDQGNDSRDLELTRRIRQEIVARGDLSFDAKNVKIITTGGKVTLRGPVSSKKEIEVIEAIVAKFASADTVSNQLEIKEDQ